MSTAKKSKAKLSKKNSTGYIGVSTTKNGKYGAQITHNGKTLWLGRFLKPEQAAERYDREAKKLFGKDAKLNFPSNKVVEKSASKPASKPKVKASSIITPMPLGQSIGKKAKSAQKMAEEVLSEL